MPKLETRNICYLGNKHILAMNLTSICSITKEKVSSKLFTKNATWELVPGPLFSQSPL